MKGSNIFGQTWHSLLGCQGCQIYLPLTRLEKIKPEAAQIYTPRCFRTNSHVKIRVMRSISPLCSPPFIPHIYHITCLLLSTYSHHPHFVLTFFSALTASERNTLRLCASITFLFFFLLSPSPPYYRLNITFTTSPPFSDNAKPSITSSAVKRPSPERSTRCVISFLTSILPDSMRAKHVG